MIRNNLLKTVKLPYKEVKGSFELRQQKAGQFTHKVMKNLSSQVKNGVSLSKFARGFKKVLPENISVFVKKNKDKESYAQLNRVYTEDNYIVKQVLELNTNEQNKINNLHIPTITHEVRHLADSLYHPKIISREQIVAKKGLDSDKLTKFYDENIYVREMGYTNKMKKKIIKDIGHDIKKVLRGLKTEDKIDVLQNMRYNLISERNAFKEENKIAKKLYNKKQDVYEDTLENSSKEYMFDEKIQLFKKMIYELIKRERGINKAKLENNISC